MSPRKRRQIARRRARRIETLKLAAAIALCAVCAAPLAFILGASAALNF